MNTRYTEGTWALFVGISACTQNTFWLNQAQIDTGQNLRDWLFFSSQTFYKIWMEWLQIFTETPPDFNSHISEVFDLSQGSYGEPVSSSEG